MSFRTNLNGEVEVEVEVEAEAEIMRGIPGEAIRRKKYKQLVSIVQGVISNVHLCNNEAVSVLIYTILSLYL